jgi:sulfur carrier protein
MTVTVNGKPMELPEGLSVEDLLARLKIRREFTAVALNREVTQRARYAEIRLAHGDKVEIVHPMGGGS